MKHLVISIVALLAFVPLWAQVDCYSSTRAQGIALMQEKQYTKAIQVFESAQACPDKPANNDLQEKISECRRKIREMDEVRKQREAEERKAAERKAEEERQRKEKALADKGYMEVTGLTFGNVDYRGNILTAEGKSLYEDDIRYLKPFLYYKGLAKETKSVKLGVKVINPDGTLHKGEVSTNDYSYETNVTVSPAGGKLTLLGWGLRKGGDYPAGTYSCEVWCNGNRLISRIFTVLPKKDPSEYKDLPLYITDMSFANVEQNGSFISRYDENLYSEDLRYLKGKIKYSTGRSQKVPLSVRIFDNDGVLKTGSSSPAGYTFIDTCSLSVGTDKELVLSGWGKSKESSYQPGSYLYEVWHNGVKLFSKTINIQEYSWRSAIKQVFKKTTKKDGDSSYKGELSSNGNKDGWGAYLWSSNSSYWGMFSGDKKSGNGLYISRSKTSTINNCPNCVYYVGDWENNYMSGKGSCYDSRGNLIYYGNFSNDKPTDTYPMSGYDAYRFEIEENPDGSYYIGETKDGKRHGKGVFIWASGSSWYGTWKDGIRNGYGIYFANDGTYTTGKWVGDNYTAD